VYTQERVTHEITMATFYVRRALLALRAFYTYNSKSSPRAARAVTRNLYARACYAFNYSACIYLNNSTHPMPMSCIFDPRIDLAMLICFEILRIRFFLKISDNHRDLL